MAVVAERAEAVQFSKAFGLPVANAFRDRGVMPDAVSYHADMVEWMRVVPSA